MTTDKQLPRDSQNGQPDIKNNRITTVESKIILPYKSHANDGHLQRAIIILRAVPKYSNGFRFLKASVQKLKRFFMNSSRFTCLIPLRFCSR